MGIFDFLGDLSSKRSKELGLGGIQSLLGTRRAAQAGAIGDEMMGITNKDSLPGYFNEQTREYVPWYVDLFDGGGLNAAGSVAEQEAAQSMAASVTPGSSPGGAPAQSPGLLANNQFSDMERRQRSNPLEPFGGFGPAIQDTPDTSYYTPPSSMQMPTPAGPGMPSYTPPSSMQMPTPASTARPGESALDTLRENVYSVGPIDAYRNALNNRPDIPLTQPFAGRDDTPRLSEMQSPMMQHPEFPKFVDLMKRSGNEQLLQNPGRLQNLFNNYLKGL